MVNPSDIERYPINRLKDRNIYIPEAKKRLLKQMDDLEKRRGVGYGFAYTVPMARTLLAMPLSRDVSFLSQEGWDFYNSQRQKDRSLKGYYGLKLAQKGDWYPQGNEPTCIAMAVTTGSLNLASIIEPELFAEFLNSCNGVNRRSSGMTEREVQAMINSASRKLRVGEVLDAGNIGSYTRGLLRVLDRRGVVLQSVKAADFYGNPEYTDGLHELAILGYSSPDQRGVDLQVADSNLGVLVLPIEFVHSVIDNNPFSLYRSSRLMSFSRIALAAAGF